MKNAKFTEEQIRAIYKYTYMDLVQMKFQI